MSKGETDDDISDEVENAVEAICMYSHRVRNLALRLAVSRSNQVDSTATLHGNSRLKSSMTTRRTSGQQPTRREASIRWDRSNVTFFLNFHVATIRDGGDLPVADRGRDSSTIDSVGLTHHFHRDSTTTIKHELKSTLATDPGRFEPLKFAGSVSGRDGNVKVGGRWSGGLTSAEPGSHSLTVLDCLAESPDFHLLKGCSACREDLFVMPLVDLYAVSEICPIFWRLQTRLACRDLGIGTGR
ncbi:hypothetical protein B0T09DRAFT_186168 [Sordaria sp. MPI-SDFR-AT-0083]|nr:hypothetical protein B0T09DRAFT_186168 [Sordaria sp. MPI-SDFR-AT-0083]